MTRLCYLFFIVLCIHGAAAAIIRKPPAFATPIYSDAYLPASMQVIYHIVDQLKRIDAEEVEQNQLLTPATSPHPPGQKQPLPTSSIIGKADEIQTATLSDDDKYYIPPERYQEEALIIARPTVNYERIIDPSELTPEVNHEVSEVVYGVPETNYELQESNHEVPEETHVKLQSQFGTLSEGDDIAVNDEGEDSKDELIPSDTTTMTVDSIVKEIYSLMKTTSVYHEDSSSPSEDEGEKELPEKSSNVQFITEGKNSPFNITAENLSDDRERSDEFKDEKRFTLLGERVDQVPRPSLMAFLRASNVTSNPSLMKLGELYDALSRDARRQGFSQFAGYSDKVLKFLEESADGGAGVQLKELLKKSIENKELSRYDAMEKTKETIATLHDDGSQLSTDLRRLLPLRYVGVA